ncbi:MAG: hypothetical protein PHP08_00735 [Candidatus Dojkabacteria bacterium]|nr:hypothetical protein [Candidatus Dojkabacteria bacterium]
MVTIIEGKYGIGFRQSPYLFNNFGFKAEIAEGNSFGEVIAKTDYVKFFEQRSVDHKKKFILKNEMSPEDLERRCGKD